MSRSLPSLGRHPAPTPAAKPSTVPDPLRTSTDSHTMGTMTVLTHSVADLRERPEFAAAVADRVWRAWWEPKGHPLAFIEDLVRRSLDGAPIPFTLVAHDGGTFLGTASVIASDLAARPQYTPWVAAVWVEPAHRSQGIGAALVRAGAERAHDLGATPVYLCALPSRHGFYEALGWQLIEACVTEAGLAVFHSPPPHHASPTAESLPGSDADP